MKIIVGSHKISFIDKYTTSYDKDKNEWNCDCIHGSIGHNHDQNQCKHTKLAKEILSKITYNKKSGSVAGSKEKMLKK